MHSPFELTALIPPSVLGQDGITAILLHANRVILGTEKGALLVFDLSAASTSSAPPAATLVSRHDGFSKKPIDQLGVIKELNALVCLSGADMTLHSLPTFALLTSFASQTRAAANSFILSTHIHYSLPPSKRSNPSAPTPAPSPSAPEIHTTLAIACRRKLLLFSWIDGTWNPPMEVGLPHQIRGMSFGEMGQSRKIVAGFSTGEYGIVTLPPLSPGTGDAGIAVLGELFSPPVPPVVLASLATVSPPSGGLGALGSYGERLGGLAKAGTGMGFGGLAKATGSVMGLSALGGLSLGGKRVDKNGVVLVPRGSRNRFGKAGDKGAWLTSKKFGWEEDEKEDEGEVLAVRENLGLPVSMNGRPRGSNTSQAIIYPRPVDETLVIPPYVVSLLSPTIPSSPSIRTSPTLQIHAIDTLGLVQSIDIAPSHSPAPSIAESALKDISNITATVVSARLLTSASLVPQAPLLLLSSVPSVLGGGEQTIWIVTMKSWESQVDELGRQGKWDESIRLLRRAGSGGGDLSPRLLTRLSQLHSLSLFNSHRYDLAIDAFIALDISPAKVVALYPSRISGKLLIEPAGQEEIFGGRLQADQPVEEESESEGASVVTRPPKVDSDTASLRSVSAPQPRRGSRDSRVCETLQSIGDRGEAERERAVIAQEKTDALNFSRSVDVLIRYLTDRRQKYAQALSALLSSVRPSPSTPRPPASRSQLLEIPDGPLTDLTPDQLARVAQVVDTALFKSYLATKPVMVGPLCRIENWCEVEEVEELLLSAKKYRELLDLYNGKNMHEKAVKLLKQMSEDEDDVDEKVGPTVRYLQKLGADHLDLIFESSRWIFSVDPITALDIFLADLEEVESLPRYATMNHLESISSVACEAYLEHIIHHLGEEGSDFHEKLIELYLNDVRSSTDSSDSYTKLLDLLETSTAYRADRVLGRLPSDDMYQVRAILLGRLGRHEGALQIYVYQLSDHSTAEEYCKRVYESDPTMRSSIFHLLLRIYLRPRPSHPLLFSPALALLQNHSSSISALDIFDLLPPLVALSDIKIFLEKTLRRSGEREREGKVLRALGKSEMEGRRGKVVELEERRVKITEGRVCPQCHKKLGNSVIAIHSPKGEVTHYQCREQFSITRNTLSS